jgi:hypothetical protein
MKSMQVIKQVNMAVPGSKAVTRGLDEIPEVVVRQGPKPTWAKYVRDIQRHFVNLRVVEF